LHTFRHKFISGNKVRDSLQSKEEEWFKTNAKEDHDEVTSDYMRIKHCAVFSYV